MATLLLIVIFLAFIGLGIPDSMIGAVWPAIYSDLNLPITYANFITILTAVFTVLSSSLSGIIIGKFGTGIVTAVSTLITAVSLLCFSLANDFVFMVLLSIPLGIGAGSIDSGLNNFVALHYKASHMNFLHCFYGLGVSLSPFIISLTLSAGQGWRGGYQTTFFVQLGISIVMFLALFLWKKVKFNDDHNEEQQALTEKVKMKSVLKDPLVYVGLLIFAGSCSVEFTFGTWGSTFFVESRGMTADMGALAITFYYAGMALGRFTAGLLSNKFKPWQLIIYGQIITFIAIAIMFFPVGNYALIACMFFVAFGNGPVFPNMAHLTPKHFGKEASQTVMGLQMAACYVGVTAMPFVFSLIADKFGLHLFPYFNMVMFAIMILGTVIFRKMLKKRNKI
jgi:fucose permease